MSTRIQSGFATHHSEEVFNVDAKVLTKIRRLSGGQLLLRDPDFADKAESSSGSAPTSFLLYVKETMRTGLTQEDTTGKRVTSHQVYPALTAVFRFP